MNIEKIFVVECVNNEHIKITYTEDKPISVTLSTHLWGLDVIVSSVKHTFKQKNEWFIPYVDYTGCKYLSVFDDDRKVMIFEWLLPPEITQKASKQNLICIGMNKTGTTSFQHDTEKFGFKYSITFDGMTKLMSDIHHGDYYSTFSYLDNPRYNAYKDFPFSLPNVYKKIYDHRPNDLYVLTVRNNAEEWVESMIKYFGWLFKDNVNSSKTIFEIIRGPQSQRYSNYISPAFRGWGIDSFGDIESKLLKTYNEHNEGVMEFFDAKKSRNLLVVDVSKKNELKKFTDWVGIENENNDFSWLNKRK